MKNYILPIIVAGSILTGCSASYKTGQTPDDIYYSVGKSVPAAPQQYADRQDGGYTQQGDYQNYFDGDDAYLRMKVQNGGRWNSIDDLDYWYSYNNNNWSYYNRFNPYFASPYMSPYLYGSLGYSGYYNLWSPYNAWAFSPYGVSNWYYPSYGYGYGYGGYGHGNVVIYQNKYPVYSTTQRSRSLSGYSNGAYDRRNTGVTTRPTRNGRSYSNLFESNSNNRSNSNSTYTPPTRTFSTPAPSTNSGGNSGSSRSSGSTSSGRGGRNQ